MIVLVACKFFCLITLSNNTYFRNPLLAPAVNTILVFREGQKSTYGYPGAIANHGNDTVVKSTTIEQHHISNTWLKGHASVLIGT
ncbi:MAG: hypothetical protein AAFW70_04835 [Cyanobacteria bacterium J06635_10]